MKLYEWALSVPWCIMQPALDLMLDLAAREDVDEEALKQVMHGPTSLALRNGQRREDSATMQVLDGVARIVIDGPIYRYASFFTRYSGGVATEALAKDFQSALSDPAVGAIAFVIDSPGGEGIAINEFADSIYAARGRKPMIAYIEGYGASAAYWIASAADAVIVDDSALVGSIGTVFGVPDPSKRVNSTITIVSSQSPKKRVDVSTPEGRAVVQQMADDLTEVFIAKVMRNRGMTRQQVLDLGGGVVIGQQAIDAGLADRLGAEDTLIRELAVKAAQRVPFIVPPARMPGGRPLRMEDTMQVFSKEWWSNLFAAQAETEVPAGENTQSVTSNTVRISADDMARIDQSLAQSLATVIPQQSTQDDPREARLAELEKQLADQKAQQIQTAATAFADNAIRQSLAMPSERAGLIRLHAQAAQDDARDPWAAPASAGEATSRVALLESQIALRPPHTLTSEQVRVGAGGVLETGAKSDGMTPERRAQLMGYTALGQTIIKRTPAA